MHVCLHDLDQGFQSLSVYDCRYGFDSPGSLATTLIYKIGEVL